MIKLLRTATFASLTALATFVAVPLPYLVLGTPELPSPSVWFDFHGLGAGLYMSSAQIFALAAVGTFLGPAGAFMSQLAYLGLGLVGVPVFAEGGGFSYLHSANFPYLLMFPFAAWLAAKYARQGGLKRRWRGLVAAELLVLAIGTLAQMIGAHSMGLAGAWLAHGWPALQTVPSLLLALVPFAFVGAVVDRFKQALPAPQPQKAPERTPLPAAEGPSVPAYRQLPGPPERLALPETQKRQLLDGPPQRKGLGDGRRDS